MQNNEYMSAQCYLFRVAKACGGGVVGPNVLSVYGPQNPWQWPWPNTYNLPSEVKIIFWGEASKRS